MCVYWRYLLAIESSGGVEWLNDGGGMPDEESVARGSGQHADDRQPHVGRTLRWVATKSDTQHVWQRLKQRPRVLLQPTGMLHYTFTRSSESLVNYLSNATIHNHIYMTIT